MIGMQQPEIILNYMNDIAKIKVSIIIPTCNRPVMLERAIRSVLAQTYQDFELIIISDFPSVDTDNVVNKFKDSRIIYIKHEKKKGASAARNTGIKKAQGEYLAFLDDDDEWLSEKLEKQMKKFQDLSDEYGLVYCWMQYYDDDKKIAKYRTPKLRGYIFKNMLSEQAIGPTSTIVIKKSIIKKIGLFNENYSRGDDGDFIRRISKQYKIDYIAELLVRYHRGHKDRLSLNTRKNIKSIIRELEDRLKKYKTDFDKCPEEKSKVFVKLAGHYLLLLRFDKWLSYTAAAFRIYPEKSIFKKLLFQANIYKENIKKF